MILWIVGTVLWYASGVASFVFWWTRSYDLDALDVMLALFAGVIGPVAFVAGWLIHGDKSRVLVHKR